MKNENAANLWGLAASSGVLPVSAIQHSVSDQRAALPGLSNKDQEQDQQGNQHEAEGHKVRG